MLMQRKKKTPTAELQRTEKLKYKVEPVLETPRSEETRRNIINAYRIRVYDRKIEYQEVALRQTRAAIV